jgi:hypothetical protein
MKNLIFILLLIPLILSCASENKDNEWIFVSEKEAYLCSKEEVVFNQKEDTLLAISKRVILKKRFLPQEIISFSKYKKIRYLEEGEVLLEPIRIMGKFWIPLKVERKLVHGEIQETSDYFKKILSFLLLYVFSSLFGLFHIEFQGNKKKPNKFTKFMNKFNLFPFVLFLIILILIITEPPGVPIPSLMWYLVFPIIIFFLSKVFLKPFLVKTIFKD